MKAIINALYIILKRGERNEAAIALMKLLQSPNIKDLIRSYGYDL